jgi:DNA replication and repair protein RecF
LLKYFAANRTFDALNLKVYDEQLEMLGESIYKKRNDFLTEFTPIFEARYQTISNGKESVSLKYKTQLDEGKLADLLEKAVERDRILQYTSVGIHKDDLQFEISGYPIKKFGSQGQQKSFLIALKLAEFDFIKNQSKVKPILLLDDIFDKLDEKRVSKIIDLVNHDDFGQIFISDTHADRTEKVVKKTNQSYQLFKL